METISEDISWKLSKLDFTKYVHFTVESKDGQTFTHILNLEDF